MDEIADRFTGAMLEMLTKANDRMGKIMLEKYDQMEVNKAQQEYDLQFKEI